MDAEKVVTSSENNIQQPPAVITIDDYEFDQNEQEERIPQSNHFGVAQLNVIWQDYRINEITDISWLDDTHITGYMSLMIDYLSLQEMVAFTAPDLIQRLSVENLGSRILNFITNLRTSTTMLFIPVCLSLHWTFFYFNKTTLTLKYYDPLNGNPPQNFLIEIVQVVVQEAFGRLEIWFQFIKIPRALMQRDRFNCGVHCLILIRKILQNEPLDFGNEYYNVTEQRKAIKGAFEAIAGTTLDEIIQFPQEHLTLKLPQSTPTSASTPNTSRTPMIFKTPNKVIRTDQQREYDRILQQNYRSSMSEEKREALRIKDRLAKSRTTSQNSLQTTPRSSTSQNSSASSTPKRRQISASQSTPRNVRNVSSFSSLVKRSSSQISGARSNQIFDDDGSSILMANSKMDIFGRVFDDTTPPPPKRRQSSQMSTSKTTVSQSDFIVPTSTPKRPQSSQRSISNGQRYSADIFQSHPSSSHSTPQSFDQFHPSSNFIVLDESQHNHLMKSITDIIDLVELYINLEDKHFVGLVEILSASEELEFKGYDYAQKEKLLQSKKDDVCERIKNSIYLLTEIYEIAVVKQIVFDIDDQKEAVVITSFIFDGIQNNLVEDVKQIQIAQLISMIRFYIRKAKFISQMTFDEAAKNRESLRKLLNKEVLGIQGTNDYDNRRIFGFSFHVVNRNEHVAIGAAIRDISVQIYNNFMSKNPDKLNDYIFVHPGTRSPCNTPSQDAPQCNISSTTSQNKSQLSAVTVSQSNATGKVNQPQISTVTDSPATTEKSQELFESEIMKSQGFTSTRQAKSYINATRGYLCHQDCPAVPSDLARKMIPFIQDLAYANSSNLFSVIQNFQTKCLPLILVHAPCFQGLRSIKRHYYELLRYAKIMDSINEMFYEYNFKKLEEIVNNQKLPPTVAAELKTKFLSKVSDLTEPVIKEKYGSLMEKFEKADNDIAAFYCQICLQIFKASALSQMKYEDVQELCSEAISTWLQDIHADDPEVPIRLCKYCKNEIKKKKLPCVAATNELGVSLLDGVLQTLNKLEWALLKPVRISQTFINIFPNQNYKMLDLTNSVRGGKPITVTKVPSTSSIKIYIHCKVANLEPIISRPKLLEAFRILKSENPFYENVQYDPNFRFNSTSVEFVKVNTLWNPDYTSLIAENKANVTVENLEFHGFDQDLNPMQQGTVLNRFLKRKHLNPYINSTTSDFEVKCFPNCFPDGKFGRVVPTRKVPLSDTKWIKNRINHISRQFLDSELLMFLKTFKDTKALFGAVNLTFREIKDIATVDELIQTFQEKRYSVVIDSALTTKFQSLRGSLDYFDKIEKELQCAVDTIGPPAFFVTANPSPADWENLKRTYLTIYSNIQEWDYNSDKMIFKDPVIFSTYFRNKLNNLLRIVIMNKGPLGEIIQHSFRIDYQDSNLTHAHMIFWSKNDVTFKKLGEQKCIELIDSIATCRDPDPIFESHAHYSVNKFQKHGSKCTSSCLVKTSDGENFVCRYGFPKREREYTKLNLKNGKLMEDKSMEYRQYELKRSKNEELIGDYNLALLMIWQGNMNVQVLLSEDVSKLIEYLTKAMSPKALAECKEVNDQIGKNLTVSNVAKLGFATLKNKPVGPIECVEHLLQMPLCQSSFDVIFMNTNPPEKRRKTLSTHIDPDDLTPYNIYQTTLLDNYLPGRDNYLQRFCYYNIVANFKIVRKHHNMDSKNKDENVQANENPDDSDNGSSAEEIYFDDTVDSSSSNSTSFNAASQTSDPKSQDSIATSETSNATSQDTTTTSTSSTSSSNPSKKAAKEQEKYGGNLFFKANYSVFNEKSPTFCHPNIPTGKVFPSGWKNVYFCKRSNPIIPRFYLPYFDEIDFVKANDFFRRQCVMFIPFDKEDDLKSDEGYIKKFMDFFENLHENHKEAADDILRITNNHHQRFKEQFETSEKLQNEIIEESEELGIEKILEIDDSTKLAWLKIAEIDQNLHQQMVQSLNTIQRQIYDDAITVITNQENSNASQTENDGDEVQGEEPVPQIMKFVSGVAGTGKSHLIKTLSQHLILNYTETEEYSSPAVIIVAPTAFAALPLNGNTIHSVFALQETRARYKPMSSEVAAEKKVLFDNCKLIIIDEISMVSNVVFMEINLRCQEITGCKKLFGGLNVMVFGDLLQLPAIKSLQVFEPLSSTQIYSHFVGGTGLNLWEEFEYHELQENMRQQNALIYANALQRLRTGETTEEDFTMFKSRICFPNKTVKPTFAEMAQYYLNLCKTTQNVMAIFSKVIHVNLFNAAVMRCKNLSIINIFARNSTDSQKNKNTAKPWMQECFDKNKVLKFLPLPKSSTSLKSQHATGNTKLPQLIRVAIGCRILLKKNLNLSKGLVNGALGTLRGIKRREIQTRKGVQNFVDKLLIEFDHTAEEITVISRETVKYKNIKGTLISRSQFPISVAYSCTIHKGQGASLDTVMVSLESFFEGGQAYVALSRVKTLEGLHISVWDSKSFKVNIKAILEYSRLRETIGLPPFNIPNQDQIVSTQIDYQQICQGNGILPLLKLKNVDDKRNCINSTLQILRIIPELNQWLQNHQLEDNLLKELQPIFFCIGKEQIGNSENFGATVSTLNEEAMLDPLKLIDLILNNFDDEVKRLWQFKRSVSATCRDCAMKYEVSNELTNILQLELPQSLGKQKFKELLKYNENNQQIRQCLHCAHTSPHQINIDLSWPTSECDAKYLLVALDRYNRQESKALLHLTDHSNRRQRIGKKTWTLLAAIEHKGATKFSGSYTPWIRDKKEDGKQFWHKIFDDTSFEIGNLVNNLSNYYILLYKKA